MSGLTLLAASWFLLRTWFMRRGLGSRPVPVLLGISGLPTAVSGACAVVLAVAAPEAAADAAILAHRVTGPAFVVWLAAIGVMLVTGRVEERFAALAEEPATEESAE